MIWWERKSYASATAACKAMKGVESVSGWDHLHVLSDDGCTPLGVAYDKHQFMDPPPWKRPRLRDFLGDVRPESLGLIPTEDPP